jgi:hypothetical protein
LSNFIVKAPPAMAVLLTAYVNVAMFTAISGFYLGSINWSNYKTSRNPSFRALVSLIRYSEALWGHLRPDAAWIPPPTLTMAFIMVMIPINIRGEYEDRIRLAGLDPRLSETVYAGEVDEDNGIYLVDLPVLAAPAAAAPWHPPAHAQAAAMPAAIQPLPPAPPPIHAAQPAAAASPIDPIDQLAAAADARAGVGPFINMEYTESDGSGAESDIDGGGAAPEVEIVVDPVQLAQMRRRQSQVASPGENAADPPTAAGAAPPSAPPSAPPAQGRRQFAVPPAAATAASAAFSPPPAPPTKRRRQLSAASAADPPTAASAAFSLPPAPPPQPPVQYASVMGEPASAEETALGWPPELDAIVIGQPASAEETALGWPPTPASETALLPAGIPSAPASAHLPSGGALAETQPPPAMSAQTYLGILNLCNGNHDLALQMAAGSQSAAASSSPAQAAAAAGGISRRSCWFWPGGTCTKGARCLFRHSL